MLSTVKILHYLIPPSLRFQVDVSLFAERASRIKGDEVAYGTVASPDPMVPAYFTAPKDIEWFLSLQKTKAPALENRYMSHSVFDFVPYNPEDSIKTLCPTP